MISRKEDLSQYFERAVFIVLFFLLISAFSDKSATLSGNASNSKSISYSELLSQVSALNNAQQFPCQKTLIPFIENAHLILLNDCHKIIAANRAIDHKILFLQKDEALIKPVIHRRFYFQFHSIDIDEPPVLS